MSGSTLSFVPMARPYLPGEVVQYTVTTAATGSGGSGTLVRPRAGQFMTAALGGTGTFGGGSDVT